MIQAIETRYRGHRFRSRLEARWAVTQAFIDAVEKARSARFEFGEEG